MKKSFLVLLALAAITLFAGCNFECKHPKITEYKVCTKCGQFFGVDLKYSGGVTTEANRFASSGVQAVKFVAAEDSLYSLYLEPVEWIISPTLSAWSEVGSDFKLFNSKGNGIELKPSTPTKFITNVALNKGSSYYFIYNAKSTPCYKEIGKDNEYSLEIVNNNGWIFFTVEPKK